MNEQDFDQTGAASLGIRLKSRKINLKAIPAAWYRTTKHMPSHRHLNLVYKIESLNIECILHIEAPTLEASNTEHELKIELLVMKNIIEERTE